MHAWPTPELLLRQCYQAALRASDPGTNLRRVLADIPWTPGPTYLLAIGKAAESMSEAAVEWASGAGGVFISSLLIVPHLIPVHTSNVNVFVGDHPVPAGNSMKAANAIGEWVGQLPEMAMVHVLISGGATALIGGPLPGLTQDGVASIFQLLLSAGVPIHETNAIRKRMTRWSAGRLAKALAPRKVLVWLLSDVMGDDPSDIASGPCHGDPFTAVDVDSILNQYHLKDLLPPHFLLAMKVETLKPDDSVFNHVMSTIIAGNQSALDGILSEARRIGCPQRRFATPLHGEAGTIGREFATETMRVAKEWHEQNQSLIEESGTDLLRPLVLYQGGETTVTITGTSGRGGRSQEFALAAAEMFEVSPYPVTLLAAGTDGRDGNSDAAGAIVSENTWEAIKTAGIDPRHELAGHNTDVALRAADALIVSGLTGGNVCDVVIAVVGIGIRS